MQYEIPKEKTVVKRLFVHDSLENDRFAIIINGRQVAELGYRLARQYWLGRKTLEEVKSEASE